MRVGLCVAAVLLGSALSAQTAPDRPQFEVASVKPATSDASGNPSFAQLLRQMRRNGAQAAIPMASPDTVRIQDWAVLDLIAAAYGVRATQVSGPDWIADGGFDIDAKVPVGTPREQLSPMLQSLLEERFGLKVHRETKTSQGFALVVAKDGPKMDAADPPPATPAQPLTDDELKARQQKMQEQNKASMEAMRQRAEEVGAFSTRSWNSVGMEELAAYLVASAGAPVVDETGLTGKYKVKVETWQNADVPGGTVFDAVAKLGLKLEPRKVSVDTIVVDHVEKMPTEN